MKAVSIMLHPTNELVITVAPVISVKRITMIVKDKYLEEMNFSNCLLNWSMKNAVPVPIIRMIIVINRLT
jgi:hypothetical protein